MLQRLMVRNFLSHKNTTLDFTKGLNVFIGNTKSGKSSIVNAIKWVKDNRPLGDAYRSRWGGNTMVSFEADDHTVQRIKSQKVNKYIVDGGEPLMAGSQVPEEVSRALNMDDINIEDQFDPHFLLHSSPGEVAQHYSRLARLDDIDEARKRIQRWIDQYSQNKTSAEAEKEKYEEDLKAYQDLPDIESRVEEVERLQEERNKLETDRAELKNLIGKIESRRENIKNIESGLEIEDDVNNLVGLVEDRDRIDDDLEQLGDIIRRVSDSRDRIERYRGEIEVEDDIDDLIDTANNRDKVKENITELAGLIQKIVRVQKRVESKKKEISRLQEEFNEYAGNTCPLCLGKGTIEKL